MKTITLLISFILLCGTLLNSQTKPGISVEEIMAVLCGEQEISEGYRLVSRYSADERARTREYLRNILKDLGIEALEHEYQSQKAYMHGVNIYGILPATVKTEETIVLGAHYDSVPLCPGANDNASGIAIIIDILSKLMTLDHRTLNLMIVFFDQEETGRLGSKNFAKFLQDKNAKIHSVHTVDQMGWDEDKDRVVELELPDRYLEQIYSSLAHDLNIKVLVTDVESSDHQSFRSSGIRSIGLTEEFVNGDTTPYYHSGKDTFATIDFGFMRSSSLLIYSVLEWLLEGNK